MLKTVLQNCNKLFWCQDHNCDILCKNIVNLGLEQCFLCFLIKEVVEAVGFSIKDNGCLVLTNMLRKLYFLSFDQRENTLHVWWLWHD